MAVWYDGETILPKKGQVVITAIPLKSDPQVPDPSTSSHYVRQYRGNAWGCAVHLDPSFHQTVVSAMNAVPLLGMPQGWKFLWRPFMQSIAP